VIYPYHHRKFLFIKCLGHRTSVAVGHQLETDWTSGKDPEEVPGAASTNSCRTAGRFNSWTCWCEIQQFQDCCDTNGLQEAGRSDSCWTWVRRERFNSSGLQGEMVPVPGPAGKDSNSSGPKGAEIQRFPTLAERLFHTGADSTVAGPR
jgi:hypothetical protein